MPSVLANEGQKYFNNNFTKQAADGTDKWPEVQRREPGTFAYKYPKKKYLARRTNPILVGKTRRLKNAVNRSMKSVNSRRVVWGVYGKPGVYGSFHNAGIGQKERQFMANTYKFRKTMQIKAVQVYRKNLR